MKTPKWFPPAYTTMVKLNVHAARTYVSSCKKESASNAKRFYSYKNNYALIETAIGMIVFHFANVCMLDTTS